LRVHTIPSRHSQPLAPSRIDASTEGLTMTRRHTSDCAATRRTRCGKSREQRRAWHVTDIKDRPTGSSSRMRRTSVLTAIVTLAPLCVIGVVLTAQSWWDGVIVAVGLLLTLGVLKDWSLDGYPTRAIFALVFTGAAWLVGALFVTSPISFVPFALMGALLLARLPKQRLLGIVAFSLAVATIGASAVIAIRPTWPLIGGYVLLPMLGTLLIASVVTVNEWSWQLVQRLERAIEAEPELAIAHERLRFADDLHDIQGHSLHVIKLKAALAQRLVLTDPERTAVELGQIRHLVDDTIAKTRELVYGQHKITFASELENARYLCEAIGIEVEISQNIDAQDGAHPLLAHVLREATTNLLRHATPSRVSITATKGSVEVANDGLTRNLELELSGLARLRDRIEQAGGELRIHRTRQLFTVSAELNQQGFENAVVRSSFSDDESR
ncbi:MAG: sensor histidine kinase, partial [Rhodococcus sp. (in: high G+C Gram-positive bacteria)]